MAHMVKKHTFITMISKESIRALLLASLALAAGMARAAEFGDKRDKAGEVQVLRVAESEIPPSTPRTAEEERQSFQLVPGFKIELVACEPLVESPVVTQIAPDGRLWVVEMRGFMAAMDGQGEELPVGRVSVLEDTDGDGRMDKSTVFLDGLVLPRALLLVGDGALIGAPPKLWYCRDTDGDGRADEKTEVAGDFGAVNNPINPLLGNPEQAANSLLWGFDNWIHAAHHSRKFRFEAGKFTAAPSAYYGQWGLAQDDDGHLFYNSNQDPLRVDILPAHYLARNPDYESGGGLNIRVYADQLVWPARVNTGVNRGYRDGILRENGRLKEFTAACAPHIYRGGAFGAEFEGNAFICEPAGNLIKRELMTAQCGTLSCKEAYVQREFIASTDERFRPVNLTTGPDGALYVTDLYRGVLQHRESFTTYLRGYSEKRGLDKPLNLGRIWRIAPESVKPYAPVDLKKESSAQLVAHLSKQNNWWRETAQRLLVERGGVSAVPALKKLVLDRSGDMGKVHALWVLDGLHQLDEATVMAALSATAPRVRATAIRLCESVIRPGGAAGEETRSRMLFWLRMMARTPGMDGEPEPFVQQQLALTLGEAADHEADRAMAALACRAVKTEYLADAIASGLTDRELPLLEELVSDAASNDALVAALARCIMASRKVPEIERLVALAASSKKSAAVLEGALSAALRKPVKLAAEPAALRQIADARAAKFSALLVWPGKPGVKPEPPLAPLTQEQQARYEMGRVLFTGVCAACHQPHGKGLDGVAPPLMDSEWVLGPEQRLVRIVLHGLTGPLSVKGKTYYLDMPAFGSLPDEQISAVLTYLRREWEHTAAPVEPATVKAIRAATADRREAWTQDLIGPIR
jgi:mono/diheme cytochrome c family protein/glucose/arabinose dehydrogenase